MAEPGARKEEGADASNESGWADGLQMTPDLMRDLARRAAEFLVERIERLPEGDAWEGDFRQELEKQLMEDPPEAGRPAVEVLERAARQVLPVAVQHDHPRFFGFIPSSPTWPGVLADFLAAGWNINTVTWLVASGPSQLELVVIDWIWRWLGYPESAGGLFTSGGSAASIDALVAAREAAGSPERATVYMSDQSHTVLSRGAMIIGVRPECVRAVPSDRHFRLDMAALALRLRNGPAIWSLRSMPNPQPSRRPRGHAKSDRQHCQRRTTYDSLVYEKRKRVAPWRGFSGYQSLLRASVGQGLRVDLERLEERYGTVTPLGVAFVEGRLLPRVLRNEGLLAQRHEGQNRESSGDGRGLAALLSALT